MNARTIKRNYNNSFKRNNTFYNRKLRRRGIKDNNSKQPRTSRYRIRREKRNQLSQRRFNYNFQKRYPNRRRNNNFNQQVDQLSNKLNKLTLNEPTNLQKHIKEPRKDKIITPMEMALQQKYISMSQTSNKIFYTTIYSKFDINVQATTAVVWFPYCISFKNFYPPIIVDTDKTSNCASSLVVLTRDQFTIPTAGTCNITGSYRVVGSTLKIFNVSSVMNRSGDYTIYKLNENALVPVLYNDFNPPTHTNSPELYSLFYGNTLASNYSQATIKNNFSANDKCVYINEYNTNEGNNIFNNSSEYLGMNYENKENKVYAQPGSNGNVIGSNIKYYIRIPGQDDTQSYTIETWQVIELIPLPSLGLSNMCYSVKTVYPPNIIQEINNLNPLSKI